MTDAVQELFFGPRTEPLRVADFERLLEQSRGWMLARQILRQCGLPPDESHRRWLRGLAEQSQRVLSGQRGYCDIAHASLEELHHAAAWLESQSRKMAQRAIHLRQAAHRKIAA